MTGVASMSLLVLTEDGSDGAIRALVACMLSLVDPAYRADRCRMEPVRAKILRGNAWKDRNRYDEAVDLARSVATKLLEGSTSFVVWHIDGDTTWKRQKDSTNLAQFHKTFEIKLRQVMKQQHVDDADIEVALKRLFVLMPFYSVEAWTYQNTEVAAKACGCRERDAHTQLFDAWRADRGLLDEVSMPKDAICLTDRLNVELAEQAYPAADVDRAQKSFAAAVKHLRDSAELVRAVAATSGEG
ncbi:MAG TPA: hypothetical protein VGM56_07730 [Byssovorax sp.]